MSGPVATYAVDLLYDIPPGFKRADLLAKLRDRCGAASPVDTSSPDGLNFYFPDLRVPFKGQEMPVQVALTVSPKPVSRESTEAALRQTWDWKEAREAVEKHGSHVTLSDLLAAGLPYKSRLGFFQNVLQGVIELASPLAIYWRGSEKIVNPKALMQALEPGPSRDPLRGAVNVRRVLGKGTGSGITMDTMGLAALGLPDFECALGERAPGPVEAVLRSLARYEYDLGDVIPEGRVVKGGGDSWKCVRGPSSTAPSREVIALRPA